MSDLFFQNRRLLVLTLVLIVATGGFALLQLPRQEDPTLTPRFGLVLTRLSGATAERVEALVTEKIERELREVEEVKEISSTSRSGVSAISVELADTVDEVDPVWARVRDRLSDVRPELPADASAPELKDREETDTYTLIVGNADAGDDPTANDVIITASAVPGLIECQEPINSGPQHVVLKAALDAVNRWVRDGEAPPSAPLLDINEDGDGFVLDEIGNVTGGIRTSWVDAPVAVHSGLGQPTGGGSFCFLFGTSGAWSQHL